MFIGNCIGELSLLIITFFSYKIDDEADNFLQLGLLVSTEGKESDSVAAKSLHDKLESVITGILSISNDHRSNILPEIGLSQIDAPLGAGTNFQTPISVTLSGGGKLLQQKHVSYQFEGPLIGRQLPQNWHALINRYYNNVHCWFPIIPKQDVLRRAHAVSTGMSNTTLAPGDLASLWAVFAYALYYETSIPSDTASNDSQRQETCWETLLQDVMALSMSPTVVAEAGHVSTRASWNSPPMIFMTIHQYYWGALRRYHCIAKVLVWLTCVCYN